MLTETELTIEREYIHPVVQNLAVKDLNRKQYEPYILTLKVTASVRNSCTKNIRKPR